MLAQRAGLRIVIIINLLRRRLLFRGQRATSLLPHTVIVAPVMSGEGGAGAQGQRERAISAIADLLFRFILRSPVAHLILSLASSVPGNYSLSGSELTRFRRQKASKNDSHDPPGESFLPTRIRKGVRQRAVMRSAEWHNLCLSKENKNEPGKPVSFIRLHKDAAATWLSRLLPAAIFILVGLFSIMVIRDYGRESAAARQTLLEKGNVLIRALESGTRVGMGMRMHHAQQQTLLEEMAGQPGVLWFAVTDAQGVIITHSNPGMVGKSLYSPSEMHQLNPGPQERWRRVDVAANGETVPALEIYRQFQPLFGMRGHGMRGHGMARSANDDEPAKQTIFIAFDASELAATQAREWRNTLIVLSALAAVLLATLLAFFGISVISARTENCLMQ